MSNSLGSDFKEGKVYTGGTCAHCGVEDAAVVNTHIWKMIFPLCLDCRESFSIRHLEDRLVPALGRLRSHENN